MPCLFVEPGAGEPPLRAEETYVLAIGAGMTGASGSGLARAVLKRFRAVAPMRQLLAADDWTVLPPAVGSRAPLLLRFARPLDWALLCRAVTVADVGGQVIAGRLDIGEPETEARFTPVLPWVPVPHLASVSPELEDVCGNDLGGPFDRSLRDRETPRVTPSLLPSISPRFEAC